MAYSNAYVVTDGDGALSWSSETDEAESFDTLRDAERRAIELAKDAPGSVNRVYQVIREVEVPVGSPIARRVVL